MSRYLKHLSADLPRWMAQGWITPENSEKILADAQTQASSSWLRLPAMLTALGSLLVFVGIISLVAANWLFFPKLFQVGLLIAAMLTAFAGAHLARYKQALGIAAGLAFLGVLIFGANLMLIAQIYNLPPNPPGGALLWALGAALTAWLWPSQLAMCLALALCSLWSWFAINAGTHGDWAFSWMNAKEFHWPFLLLWAPLAFYSIRQGWARAIQLAGILFLFWLGASLLSVFGEDVITYAGLIAAALLLVFAITAHTGKLGVIGTGPLSRYVLIAFIVWWLLFSIPDVMSDTYVFGDAIPPPLLALTIVMGLWAVFFSSYKVIGTVAVLGAVPPLLLLVPQLVGTQMYNSVNFILMIALSILTIAVAIGAIMFGARTRDRFLVNLGFVLFALKVLMLYFDTFWSLGGRSLFFIIGGLLTIGLAMTIEKQRRKLLSQMEKPRA